MSEIFFSLLATTEKPHEGLYVCFSGEDKAILIDCAAFKPPSTKITPNLEAISDLTYFVIQLDYNVH